MGTHLQRVRRDLVREPDATTLLLQINQHARRRSVDGTKRQRQLLGAVALERAQDLCERTKRATPKDKPKQQGCVQGYVAACASAPDV